MSTEAQLGQIKYAIFDMDGLLSADSEEIWTEVTNSLLEKYGFPQPYTWEYKAQTMGRPPRQSAETLFSFYPGLEKKISVDDWLAERNVLHEEAFKRVRPLRGAVSLVKRLHETGVPIAIATGSNTNNFKWKTRHLPELFSLFPPTHVFTADSSEVKKGKPHPDIYLAAARGLGQDVGLPDQATEEQLATRKRGLVFEDAPLGVQAGVAAGMNVVWVPHADLRRIHYGEDFGSSQTLTSLEEFRSEQWGLNLGS